MSSKPVTFLVTDDDEVDVMALQRAFKKVRLADPVVVASNGLEALDHLRGTNGRQPIPRPYLILLDLNMPRMNGIEFLRELRADPDHRNAVVFAWTSSKDEAHKAEAYGFNVAGYIIKSAAFEDFQRLVEMLGDFRDMVELP